jgi:diguanylate cyclase (GGDEF)-like protein
MFKRLFKPTIRDGKDLWRYVFTVVSVCVGSAVSIDVVNQMIFFVDWQSTLREWALTMIESGGLSLPISLGIGRTNLELYHAKLVAESASRIDHLTGLLNRRALMASVPKIEPYSLALVIADIDLFKRINDTYGHLAGDAVIAAVAKLMADELSDLGNLARVGGEEFALITSETQPERIEGRLDAVRRKIADALLTHEGRPLRVTVSIGWAIAQAGDSFEQLYGKADRALYVAKASGRNRLLGFDRIEELATQVRPDETRDRLREAKSA